MKTSRAVCTGRLEKSAKENPGFTITELVVVLSMILIMAAVAIPNFLKYLPKARLGGAARVIAGELAAARMAAVKQNCKACVSFCNHHEYRIWVDADRDKKQEPTEVHTKDLHPDYPDVEYDGEASTGSKIGFTPRGTGGPFCTFVLSNGEGTKRIVVNIAGRIQIR
ncbi:MAG: GspH/FimT family pseudopilin [Desulfobacterales bacterium]